MAVAFGWSLDFVRVETARRIAMLVVAIAAVLGTQAAGPIVARAGGYDASLDAYSLFNVTRTTGAQAWWRAGYTGAGVDIAVIDSGVAPVDALTGAGKLVHGPDLSLESQALNLRALDTFGHGTAMIGLIAANDGGEDGDTTRYRGMAPGARIVSIKVATADGGTDVSQVIAAIDWVVQHRTDNGLNIRILSLSYGTNSTQPYTVDPLAYAAEQAWKHGLVVVAAAGNSGYQRGKGAAGLASPAYDPFVIAVGATTLSADGKESVASYSASGPSTCSHVCRNPSLVAPGSHLQLLRVHGSYLDQSTSSAIDDRFFRGSGTSEATAIVAGAAALILEKYPHLTPDQVKRFLQSSAVKIQGANEAAQGKGRINLAPLLSSNPTDGMQTYEASTGTGSLELARGDDHLTHDGVILEGEQDIFGHAWDPATMTPLEAAAAAWSGGTWNGSVWTGNSWSGNSWSGNSWSGNSWSGNSWSGNSWSGNSWSGAGWS
jgi:serine protease AprX